MLPLAMHKLHDQFGLIISKSIENIFWDLINRLFLFINSLKQK
jgi:hypothetical protein